MKIFAIADLHFGKLPNEEELYRQLNEEFIKKCYDEGPDIIVIAGDSYDSRQPIESKANIYFNKFISDCIDTNAIIIVIEGTYSHDRFQINSLLHYSSDKFIIVNTVTKLNLLGLNLLILPEEYVKDGTYYEKYMEDTYDFVFFHGMFSHVGFSGKNDSGLLARKSHVFDWKDFKDNTKFYVVGGHIHTHSIFKNVIYCGSFARLNFGEEEAKGFMSFTINSKGKCKYEFIENKQSQSFKDVLASKLPTDIDNLTKQLRNYAEFNDFVRVVLDDNDESKKSTVEGFVKSHANCAIKRIQFDHINDKEERISENIKTRQDKLNEQMSQYKGLNLIEITQNIANIEYRQNFETEYINKILNTKV